MNKYNRARKSIYFARRWLEEEFTQCRRIKGFLHFLRTSGHLHSRYTSFEFDEKKYTVENLLRIEVNKAMELDEKAYFEHWNRLGKMVYDFANEHGDEFNEQYGKKENEDRNNDENQNEKGGWRAQEVVAGDVCDA